MLATMAARAPSTARMMNHRHFDDGRNGRGLAFCPGPDQNISDLLGHRFQFW